MTLLDELRDLLTADPEEDELPSKEELADRRRDVKSEIRELKSEVQRLESEKGRREAIAEADTPEEVGRRLRKVKDRLAGLRSLDEALAARQREAERREREERFNEVVADLPEAGGPLRGGRGGAPRGPGCARRGAGRERKAGAPSSTEGRGGAGRPPRRCHGGSAGGHSGAAAGPPLLLGRLRPPAAAGAAAGPRPAQDHLRRGGEGAPVRRGLEPKRGARESRPAALVRRVGLEI